MADLTLVIHSSSLHLGKPVCLFANSGTIPLKLTGSEGSHKRTIVDYGSQCEMYAGRIGGRHEVFRRPLCGGHVFNSSDHPMEICVT